MYYFIVNVHGGSGRSLKIWKKIKLILDERKIEFKTFHSLKKGHATLIAKKISSLNDEIKKVVVVGGDGTLNEVLNGFTDISKIKLGVISTGSANDFIKGLKLPGKSYNIKNLLETILNSEGNTKIDLGRLTTASGQQRIFGISSGVGLDAIVCKKTNASKTKIILNRLNLGRFSYIITTLKSIVSMKYFNLKLKFDDGEEMYLNKVIFLAGMNMFGEGGGVKMAPDARYDDGKLSMAAAYGYPKFLSFILFPFLITGTHKWLRGIKTKDFKTLEITTQGVQTVHTDGEPAGETDYIKMECLEGALSMLI